MIAKRDARASPVAVLPVGKLWGVGKVTEQELNRRGVNTIGDLLDVPREVLVGQFGDHAAHLLELAVGHDERPVVPVFISEDRVRYWRRRLGFRAAVEPDYERRREPENNRS